MLDRHLVIGCEPLDDPFTSKASNAAVLFSSEWGVRPVIHAAVLDMSHTGFHTQRKLRRPRFIFGHDGARESEFRVVRNAA